MQLSRHEKPTYILLSVIAALIIVFDVTNKDVFITPFYYFSFILVAYMYLSISIRSFTYMDVLCICIITLAFLNVLINSLLQNSEISFSYFKKVIMFSSAVLFLQTCRKLCLDDRTKKLILNLVSILCVFLIAYYFISGENLYIFRGYQSTYLCFNFTNPNFAGMFFCMLSIMQCCQITKSGEVTKKALHFVLMAFMIYFTFLTKARNSQFAVIIFLILQFSLKKKKKYNFSKSLSWIFAAMPLIFMLLYIALINTPYLNKMLGFMSSEGKELNSRLSIWLSSVQYLIGSPLVGAYSQISLGTGESQLHNTHFDILVSYGFPVMILFCIWLFNIIHNHGFVYESKEKYMLMISFIAIIALGVGEATLFSGGLCFYIFTGLFLALSNRRTDIIE